MSEYGKTIDALEREVAELKRGHDLLCASNERYVSALVTERAAKEAAEQRCAELAKVLRRVEWCLGDDMNPGPTCPWCMENKPNHHPDCELAAALAVSPQGSSPAGAGQQGG